MWAQIYLATFEYKLDLPAMRKKTNIQKKKKTLGLIKNVISQLEAVYYVVSNHLQPIKTISWPKYVEAHWSFVFWGRLGPMPIRT